MDCDDLIRNGKQRGLTDEEVLELEEYAKDLARKVRAKKSAADLAKESADLAAAKASRDAIKLAVHKRNVQKQLALRHEAVSYILDEFRGMEAEGISALLVGTSHNRKGGRLSVDARQRALTGYYIGNLIHEIKKEGPEVWAMFEKGKHAREITRALWSLDNPNAQAYSGPAQAMKIAKVVHKWSEIARRDANDAGAYIGRLAGYVVRQSHDQKLMIKAGRQAWKDFVRQRLDWSRTAEGRYDPAVDFAASERFLDETYDNLVTGIHLKAGNQLDNPLAVNSITGSEAAKMSHERVLHFLDGDGWFDYNSKFGQGDLNAAILAGLEHSAKSTGLMRVLGPAPQANLDNIFRDVSAALRKAADPKAADRFLKSRKDIQNQMKAVDGTINIPGNPSIAEVGRNLRAWQNVSCLGGAAISSFSDIPTFALEMAYQGKGFFTPMIKAIGSALKGRGSQEQRQILVQLGVFFDSMRASVAARFDAGDGGRPGRMMALQNIFFKLNGLTWWTDSFRKAAALMCSHDLATESKLAWDALKPQRRRVLSQYGIDGDMWEMLRARPMKAADGKSYFTPELAQDVDLAQVEAWHKKRGMAWTDEIGIKFKNDLEERLRSYFRDRTQFAVLEPDAKTQALMYRGLESGTIYGEAMRCIWQFKSFSVVFLQRVMAREIFGRGADSYGAGILQTILKSPDGDRSMLGMLFVMTTLFGLGSMTVKALLAGRTPRDPSDYKTWLAAAAQGGGLGIYGDFLFGSASRMGDSFLSAVAGPTMGSASSLYRVFQQFRDGEDGRSAAWRTLWHHVPGNNLFWTKLALDHAINYSIYEYLNPGSIRRAKRRLEKETGQEYLIEPKAHWDLRR